MNNEGLCVRCLKAKKGEKCFDSRFSCRVLEMPMTPSLLGPFSLFFISMLKQVFFRLRSTKASKVVVQVREGIPMKF